MTGKFQIPHEDQTLLSPSSLPWEIEKNIFPVSCCFSILPVSLHPRNYLNYCPVGCHHIWDYAATWRCVAQGFQTGRLSTRYRFSVLWGISRLNTFYRLIVGRLQGSYKHKLYEDRLISCKTEDLSNITISYPNGFSFPLISSAQVLKKQASLSWRNCQKAMTSKSWWRVALVADITGLPIRLQFDRKLITNISQQRISHLQP